MDYNCVTVGNKQKQEDKINTSSCINLMRYNTTIIKTSEEKMNGNTGRNIEFFIKTLME